MREISGISVRSATGGPVGRRGRLATFAPLAAAATMLAGAARAETWYWRGGASGAGQATAWTNALNWTNSVGANPAGTPFDSADGAVIDGGTNQPFLNLAPSGITIASLIIGQTAASTLTVSNGNVSTKILAIAGDFTIGASGTVTHAADWSTRTTVGSESNRLCMAVGGNLTIAAGGKIDVTGKGYSKENRGPGAAGSNGSGGGFGGEGGGAGGGTTYGSITNPVNNGSAGGRSGGTDGRPGGGTAAISVGGLLTLNGSILADGRIETLAEAAGAGSGGSVNITAGSLSGNGAISANGGSFTNGNGGSAGGGGRIAVVLTNADDSGFAGLAAIRAYGGRNVANNAFGGAGTVFLKATNNAFGKVIVNNNGQYSSNPGGGVGDQIQKMTLFQNDTLLVDRIVYTNCGLFKLGTNATLDLRQGCVLNCPTNNQAYGQVERAIRQNRIIIGGPGSQVLWPAAYILTNAVLSIAGTNQVALATNLVIAAGGTLTHEPVKSAGTAAESNKLCVVIAGDLTINQGGSIDVTACGYFGSNNGPGASGANSRGGHHGGLGSGTNFATTYGSVTNSVRSGSAGHNSGGTTGRAGGGAAVITVGGALTLNGSILADAPIESLGEAASCGSGGSVNIVAGALSGSGAISANGGRNGGNHAGGGGRVAVVLTNADDSAFAGLAAVRAYGGMPSSGTKIGAAGTVYLKGTNTAYGRLIVDNNGQTANLGTTLLRGDTVTDTTVGDVIVKNSGYLRLVNQTLTVHGSWSNAVATNAISGGTVEFAGTNPNPVTVWGGNNWSNLTIAAAGKTVNFQAGATQSVYGIPAFSNVTLQSTASAYWHLLKPGSGTQEVGVVAVQFCNAANGWTFLAGIGSINIGDNVNWIFPQSPPSIENRPASNVTGNSADLNGYLSNGDGAATAVWVYWGPDDRATNASLWANGICLGTNTVEATNYTAAVTGLTARTTYYYAFYAWNVWGGTWAASSNFVTSSRWGENGCDLQSSGGTKTNINGYWVHVFTNTTAREYFVAPMVLKNVEYLIVGGGGAGRGGASGYIMGGGGGAGGIIQNFGSPASVAPGVYPIMVGRGGVAPGFTASAASTNDGSATTAFGLTATGGGCGGSDYANQNGRDGGSGGGGGVSGPSDGSHALGGAGSQGHKGGNGYGGTGAYFAGGGGGYGALGVAGTSSKAGNGGGGFDASAYLGTGLGDQGWFGGGGGGGAGIGDTLNPPAGSEGSGGKGGGGRGGVWGLGPTAGMANTGGGGGGSHHAGAGDGGSGIVIIRYPERKFGPVFVLE